jgi:hypothetical protein
MSGTSIPMGGQGADILGNLLKWNQAQQAGAQASLTGQQVQGASLANQQSALMLGLRNQLAGNLAPGQGAVGGAQPGGQPGASGSQPGQSQMPAPISLPGATMTPFGVPVPRAAYISALMSPDPTASIAKTIDTGHTYMAQRLGALGPRPNDPAAAAQWDSEARSAAQEFYASGWIGPDGFQHLMQNPGSATQVAASMADPNTQLNAQVKMRSEGMTTDANGNTVADTGAQAAQAGLAGAKAGSVATAEVGPKTQLATNEAAARGRYEPFQEMTVPTLGADGQQIPGQFHIERFQPGVTPPQGARTATAGDMADPTLPVSVQGYIARQRQAESSGNYSAPAPKLPNGQQASTAGGGYGFTDQTWLSAVKAAQPALAAGKTDAQLLALKTDSSPQGQQLQDQIAESFARNNAAQLQAAGVPPSGTSLTLAQRFGATGAKAILSANSNAPLSSIVGQDALQSNPTWATGPGGKPATVGDAVTSAFRVGGANPVSLAATAAAPNTPGVVTGPPVRTPDQQTAVNASDASLKADAETVASAQGSAMRAQAAMPMLYDMRAKIPAIASGSFGDERTAFNNFMATFGPDWLNKATNATATASNQQEFVKQAVGVVTAAESQLPNARIGAMLTNYMSKALPNINMQGDAIKEMTNFLLVSNQMARDYAQDAATFHNTNRDAFLASPTTTPYQPLTKFDQQWTEPGAKSAPPVYEAAALLMNNKPVAQAFAGLSDAQKTAAVAVARRADPNFSYHPAKAAP